MDKRLFLLHMPRCGGQSIVNSIVQMYSVEPKTPGRVMTFPDTLETIVNPQNLPPLFNLLMSAEYKFTHGNYYLNSFFLNKFGDEWDFIIVLRNPVDRFISHYYLLLDQSEFLPHLEIADELSLFIESPLAVDLGNTYVRHLAVDSSETDYSSEKKINDAIESLNKFKIVGCLENLEKFGKDFETIYGVTLNIGRENVGKQKTSDTNEISESQRIQIMDLCKPSFEVYNYFFNR